MRRNSQISGSAAFTRGLRHGILNCESLDFGIAGFLSAFTALLTVRCQSSTSDAEPSRMASDSTDPTLQLEKLSKYLLSLN